MIKRLLYLMIGAIFSTATVFATPTKFLTFNGTNQYVQIPNSSDFMMSNAENLSFSFWVKTSGNSFVRDKRVLGYRLSGYAETGYEVYVLPDGYSCTAVGVKGSTDNKFIDDVLGGTAGAWTHVAVVFDRTGGRTHAYINGIEKTLNRPIIPSMTFSLVNDILLGAGWNTSGALYNYFSGSIANVRFYRGVLSQSQITSDMNTNDFISLDSNIKNMCIAAYAPSDDFKTSTLTDLTTRGNNGVLMNYTIPVEDGKIGSVTVTQNKKFTGRKNTNDVILSAAVSLSGGSVALNSIDITLDGTTKLSDYNKVKIYTTGTSPLFDERNPSAAVLLGEFTPSAGTMNCSFTPGSNLVTGTNYLWITANVSETAIEGNRLDAVLKAVVTANEKYTVANGNPIGSREILLAYKVMYEYGDKYNNENHTWRIPAMTILPNGNLVIAQDKRPYPTESDLPNDISILSHTSTDGGYTWSNMSILAAGGGSTSNGRGDVALAAYDNNIVIAAFVGDNGLVSSTPSNPISSYISRSLDGGNTWSPVVKGGAGDITNVVFNGLASSKKAAFFGSGKGLVLSRQTGVNTSKNGRIMFVTAGGAIGSLQNYIVYSDDQGVTWKMSGLAYNGGDEAKVTELDDGTVLISVRQSGPRGYNKSTDGGETWGKQGTWSELNVNACNGDIMEYTTISEGFEKNRTLHSLPTNSGGGAREKVSMYISYDEGQTWTNEKQIFNGPSGYSTMVRFADGTIGLYVEEQIQMSPSKTNLIFMRFSLKWMTNGKDEFQPVKTNRAAIPVFTPQSGTIFKDAEGNVKIECATANSTIFYTIDGSIPSRNNGTEYTGEIKVTEKCTIKAIAYADGFNESIIASALYSFPEYCTRGAEVNTGTSNRQLRSISFNGGKAPFTISGIETVKAHPIYHDLTTNVFEAELGKTISPAITWNGEWMHAYLYIDYNDDKVFTYTLNPDGTPAKGSEIVSYTYYDSAEASTGKNSLGQAVASSGSVTLSNVPSFTIPTDAKEGSHRMRVKIDWCSIDPCADVQIGTNTIAKNGGSMADFTIKLVAPVGVENTSTDDINIYGGNGNITIKTNSSQYVEVFDNRGIQIKAVDISGNSQIEMNKGLYIVHCNGKATKVNVK
ncbi:MAG: LamG-like jellyroll fold domain-containing protein [Bacteroidales bacterium]